MIDPNRAIVVPRARLTPDGASLPLHTLVQPLIERHQSGVIQIIAPPLGGKTTALGYLTVALRRVRFIGFLDQPQHQRWMRPGEELLIVATTHPYALPTRAIFYLAEWTIDDCIEYLSRAHRPVAAGVLNRLKADPHFDALGGLPALVRMVLDEFAADEALDNSIAALRRAILRRGRILQIAGQLRVHPAIARIFSAEALAESIIKSPAPAQLVATMDRSILAEAAVSINENAAAARRLAELLHGPDRSADWIAASILMQINPRWRPWVGRPLRLSNAILDGARWDKIDLQDTMMEGISLRGADLTGAILNRIDATSGIFSSAQMNGARLDRAKASNASFVHADMECLRAEKAEFLGTDFTGARLRGADLQDCDFGIANLTNTDLSRADLRGANLKATLNGTIFTRANLERADLRHVDLRTTILRGARLTRAKMLDCNLEGCEIPDADFEFADLGHSYLTGSIVRGGKFRGANLTHTGLADIDWKGADLSDADLTGASFHMGSTRSGLVGSVIPCEGSKNGFYTDEFNEQDFKSPEEIRKANLCGADLRGAIIDGVDFYLVDLRGAKYTSKQADHLARCGAILHSRVA